MDRNIRGCETLVGIKKLHQMLDIGHPGKLLVRTRSCHASEQCWKGDHSECKNNERCGKPWVVILKPKAYVSLRETPERAGEFGIKLGGDAKKGDIVCVEVKEQNEPWILGRVVGDLGSYELKTPTDTPYTVLVPGDIVVEIQKLEPVNPGTKVFDVTNKVFPVRAKDIRLGKVEVKHLEVRRSGRCRSAPARMGMRNTPSVAMQNQSTSRCEISSSTHSRILMSMLLCGGNN